MVDNPNNPMNERQIWLSKNLELSPSDALKAAIKIWPSITLKSIYTLRSELRKRGVPIPKLTSGGFPTKHPERYGKPAGKPPVKERRKSPAAMFVIGLGLDMPKPEAMAKAAAAGHKLTGAQFDAIRYRQRLRMTRGGVQEPPQAVQLALPAVPPPAVRKARKAHVEAEVLPLGKLSADEADFMGIMLRIGLNRSARLLAQFQVQFFGAIKQTTTHDE